MAPRPVSTQQPRHSLQGPTSDKFVQLRLPTGTKFQSDHISYLDRPLPDVDEDKLVTGRIPPYLSDATKDNGGTGYGSLKPTSYWSVPEQRDFPRLLAHFGRDFEGISNFMKTMTTVMVQNYYQRRLDSGHKDLEHLVLIAEEKKSRGEATGPLPDPSVAPKRRYEATPSAIVPRPLGQHEDLRLDTEEARFIPKRKRRAVFR